MLLTMAHVHWLWMCLLVTVISAKVVFPTDMPSSSWMQDRVGVQEERTEVLEGKIKELEERTARQEEWTERLKLRLRRLRKEKEMEKKTERQEDMVEVTKKIQERMNRRPGARSMKKYERMTNSWSRQNSSRMTGEVRWQDNEIEGRWSKDGDLCGDGSSYCDHPMDYPETIIAKAMKKQKMTDIMKTMFDLEQPEIEVRSRSRFDEFENVCESVERTIAPRVGTNSQNQQRYLVNGQSGLEEMDTLVRTVHVVECLGSQQNGHREECGAGLVFGGTRTECKQEYMEQRMVALDMERGELVVETFRFPSCCSCRVLRGLA